MATSGRRYRGSDGDWTIPYVDSDRFVLVRHGEGRLAVWIAVGLLLQMAGVGLHAIVIPGLSWTAPLTYVGLITTLVPLVMMPWQTIETRASRLRVPRRLVVRRVRAGERDKFEAEIDDRAVAPASKRGLLHATILLDDRLLLVWNDQVIELWRFIRKAGGGYAPRSFDWTMEPLMGDEGSEAAGPAEEGKGPQKPVIDGLRSVLDLGNEDPPNVRGPDVPVWQRFANVAVLFVGIPALGWLICMRVHDGAPAIEPPVLRAAVAIGAAAAFAGFEVLFIGAIMRWRASRYIDRVLDVLISSSNFWRQ